MTEADQVTFTAAFHRWCKGNELAMRFCADSVEIAHAWDDVVDNDKLGTAKRGDAAFRKLMLELPANGFYRENFAFLHPVMVMVWAQWDAANKMEAAPIHNDLAKTFMLRASLYQLFHACAVLCGGLDWASEVGPEIYRLYGEEPHA